MGRVRETIVANLDSEYEEGMSYGAIGYYVPHRVYPAGYHCDPTKPLPFANLASQKSHMALHLTPLYGGGGESGSGNEYAVWFQQEWVKTGKKLDMGKACVRFRRVEDLPLELIGEAIRRVPARVLIAQTEAALQRLGRARAKS